MIFVSDAYKEYYDGFGAVSVSGDMGPWLSLGTFALLMGIFWMMTRSDPET